MPPEGASPADGDKTVEPDKGDKKEPEVRMFTQEQVEKLITDRLSRHEKKVAADVEARLLVDETFRDRALSEWDVKPAKKGEGDQLTDEKVQELYGAWESKHLDPLRSQLEATGAQVTRLREAGLERDLLSEATGLVQKGLLKQQASGHAPIVDMLRGNFVWDAEGGEWRVKGTGDGFRPSPSGDRLYMTPAEYLTAVWAVDPANEWAVLDSTQRGADSKSGQRTSTDGKRIYTESEYHRALENAEGDDFADAMSAQKEGRVRRDAA